LLCLPKDGNRQVEEEKKKKKNQRGRLLYNIGQSFGITFKYRAAQPSSPGECLAE
jgi:hypothetical protein